MGNNWSLWMYLALTNSNTSDQYLLFSFSACVYCMNCYRFSLRKLIDTRNLIRLKWREFAVDLLFKFARIRFTVIDGCFSRRNSHFNCAFSMNNFFFLFSKRYFTIFYRIHSVISEYRLLLFSFLLFLLCSNFHSIFRNSFAKRCVYRRARFEDILNVHIYRKIRSTIRHNWGSL